MQSAGVVVFRPGKQVLLVHRPKYDDWSFPKGKLDRGEHATTAAVREVEEETGLRVRLGTPLSQQRYPVAQGMKTVSYWTGRSMGSDDVSGYLANEEIDERRVGVGRRSRGAAHLRARRRDPDRGTGGSAAHGAPDRPAPRAGPLAQGAWRSDDRARPLLQAGRLQAQRLVPVLAAYDVRRVISSSSVRCHADRHAVRRRGRSGGRGDRSAQRGGRLRQEGEPDRRGPRSTPRSDGKEGSCSARIARCCHWSSTRSAWSVRSWTRARCWWPICARGAW